MVLVPLALLPLVISGSKEARCGFVVLLMAVYWMTEAVPLPVTSLLPVVLFPLLGVLSTDKVCINYFKETNMMFVGGLIVAIAVEYCNLHKRIALKTILIIGTSPRRLMLGFMITTSILSMWISNTATTAMMVPILQAVIDELKAQNDDRRPSQIIAVADSEEASGGFDHETRRKSVVMKKQSKGPKDRVDVESLDRPDQDTICYYLGVAYASNLGGAGTLTGTGTNLTFHQLYNEIASKYGITTDVNFASWMKFAMPLTVVNIMAAWVWLQILFMGLFRKEKKMVMTKDQSKNVRELIRKKYDELGPMSFHEGSTLTLFIAVVLLWFFREPGFITGWAKLVSDVGIEDATPVMLIVFLLFVLPSNLSFLNPNTPQVAPSLLHWKLVHEKVPWGLVLLLGGGFAMANASEESGLSNMIGKELLVLKPLAKPLILIIICTATCFLTEVSSNTAIANIVLPVLGQMAVAMETHPLYYMMPATLGCSYAFMLPVATPPNAIVMAASNMRTTDMMRAGIGMNIICLIILCASFPTLGSIIYGLNDYSALNGTTRTLEFP